MTNEDTCQVSYLRAIDDFEDRVVYINGDNFGKSDLDDKT